MRYAINKVEKRLHVSKYQLHLTAYFMKGDELVYTDTGFCADGNNEVAPEKKQGGEAKSRGRFDRVMVCMPGFADQNNKA